MDRADCGRAVLEWDRQAVTLTDGGGLVDKQIGQHYQESSVIALEGRVRVLENRVTALYDVVRILAHGLEDLLPPSPAGGLLPGPPGALMTCCS